MVPIKKLPLEKDIQRECCEWLDKEGFFFWRSNNIPVFGQNNGGNRTFRSMGKYSPKGIPDIILIYNGKFIALEIKRPKAKLRPDQEVFQARCADNGAKYFVIHSLDELKEVYTDYILEI